MPKPLSLKTTAVIKSSVPALAAHGPAITKAMYDRLFLDDHIRALFNHSNQGEGGSQVNALATAILAYARNIENLEPLLPVVERIAQKHIGYNILPEHYPFVARALLDAITDVLGAAATPELLDAWAEGYWFLADLLKEREADIRRDLEQSPGGWTGWRQFIISERIRESEVITSFILRPSDGSPVIRHHPGQYLTLRFELEHGTEIKRNYSISSAPNDEYYRISVKREAAGSGGSRHLHDIALVGDTIYLSPPAGDFFLNSDQVRPVILLSAGVGLTPMVSMIESINTDLPALEVHYIHAALNSSTHAMDRHVRSIAKSHGRIAVSTFYSDPGALDVAGQSHDYNGFINIDWLRNHTPFVDADFYLCGPKPFLRSLINGLWEAGIEPCRIHFEFFGPSDELLAA
ncbi:NO-inducible flavohemoprotein [Neorhizobium sp. AL 9.2.2]|uniref:NO-inducible flavohemoprotein n=1 Tax=Neorhizobium sp. AL 9.2.2 TaxID=2712894 RepID=UPI001573AB7A|nr:NO-inducible flavohemoprotein [Neorhizobium sp. AL 9.2.2]NSY20170.1 NO-inducible flavohemoprotein [Neorhizobium sp. AL 9.2.2]